MQQPDTVKIYKDFIDKHGEEQQLLQVAEEASEVIKAVLKYIRYKGTDKEIYYKNDLVEEMGDMFNALYSVFDTLGIQQPVFDYYRLKKLQAYHSKYIHGAKDGANKNK
jgi:NTP pyrophosphatase (non-canonical NTP hydrolase)